MAPSSEIFIDDILKKSLIFKEKRLDLIGMDEPRKNAEKSINPEKMIDKILKSGYSSKVQNF